MPISKVWWREEPVNKPIYAYSVFSGVDIMHNINSTALASKNVNRILVLQVYQCS